MNEEKLKKFYMNYVHQSHLPPPIAQRIDEDKPEAHFTYPLDMGSCQRIYTGRWVYTIYQA